MPMWNPWRGCRRCSEGCAHCYIHKGDAKRGVDTSEIVQTKDFYKPVEQLKKGGYKMKPGLVYLGFSTDFLCSFCLYPKEQSAKAVRALQIVRPCPSVPLLCAAGDSGVGKSVERRRRQLFACGNGLPHCVHALRRLSGRGDLPGPSVQGHRKGPYQIRCHHFQRHLRHWAYHQAVQRQRHESGKQSVPDRLCRCGGLPAGHVFLSRRRPDSLHPRAFRHQHARHVSNAMSEAPNTPSNNSNFFERIS